MDITYIGHSGFLLEWENCYWIFDYYKGEIPNLATDKMIIVFVSHMHGDHYNPDIFNLSQKYQNISYVLSSDIKLNDREVLKFGLSDEIIRRIHSVKPSHPYEFFDLCNNRIALKTLKSTDSGVAFLLNYQGRTIYHAGDLNLWVWKGETKQYNNNMRAMFQKQMCELKELSIDVAFAPLDPRQEEDYYLGLESLLETAKVSYVFPMHFWDQPSIIDQFKKERPWKDRAVEIFRIDREGQHFCIEIKN